MIYSHLFCISDMFGELILIYMYNFVYFSVLLGCYAVYFLMKQFAKSAFKELQKHDTFINGVSSLSSGDY